MILWSEPERARRACAVSVAYGVGNNRTERTCINSNPHYSPENRATSGMTYDVYIWKKREYVEKRRAYKKAVGRAKRSAKESR